MEESTNKEKVLKNIRNALIQKNENPYQDIDMESNVFQGSDSDREIVFAEELKKMAGAFHYCQNENEFLEILNMLVRERGWDEVYTGNDQIEEMLSIGKVPSTKTLPDSDKSFAGITYCEFLIARLGSVMVSSSISDGRRSFIFPETHIVLGFASQMVYDLKDAFEELMKKYQGDIPSLVTVITGPSRTADIEKTLVMGAHGPKELIVFLIDDEDMPVS